MDVILIRCPACERWSRLAAADGALAKCPHCDALADIPRSDPVAAPAPPRRRWKRLILALTLTPLLGFAVGAASGDWRGVWKAVQARRESERQAQARFDEALAKGRAREVDDDLRAAITAYKDAAALEAPGSTRRRQADEAHAAAVGKRAEAHRRRLKAAEKARAARDYAAAEAALVADGAAFDPAEPEAVAAAKALEKVRADAARLPQFRTLLARGDDLYRAKRYEPALKAFVEAKALFPEDDAVDEAIRRAETEREILAAQLDDRAGAAEAAGDLEKSAALLAQLVDEVGGNRRGAAVKRLADARSARAGKHARLGREAMIRRDFEAAAREFDGAIAAGSNAPDVLAGKRDAGRELALKNCDALLTSGRYAEALDAALIADQSGSGDPRTAATAADARTAVEYAEIRRFRVGEAPIRSLAFRPADGRLVIVTASGVVQAWDARNGRFVAPAWERRPAGPRVEAVALSEDGRWAALATRASVELIDLDAPDSGPRLIALPSAVAVLAVADGPDGNPRLVAGHGQGSAWAWPSADRGARPVVLASPTSLPVTTVRIARGSGDVAVGRESGPVDLYRANGQDYVRRPLSDRNAAFHRRPITCLTFSPDGMTLLAGRDVGSIASWSLGADGRTLVDRPMDREVVAMSFSPDGGLFAAASEDRTICIGDTRKEEGAPIFRKTIVPALHRDAVRALAFDGRAVLATGGADGAVKLWSLERGKLAAAVGQEVKDAEAEKEARRPSPPTSPHPCGEGGLGR